MSKDASQDGFSSKFAKLFHTPIGRLWSAEDAAPELAQTQAQAIAAARARNDFVRKHEFDFLRKMHQRRAESEQRPEAGLLAMGAKRTSGVHRKIHPSSTVLKIDEVEAQISKQWWQDPQAQLPSSGPPSPSGSGAGTGRDEQGQTLSRGGVSTYAGAQMSSTMNQTTAHGLSTQASEMPTAGRVSLSRSQTGAEPDLEKAAVLFANGDYNGAENTLVVGIEQAEQEAVQRQSYWLALFDLYRASGQRAPFDQRALVFVRLFERSAPQWFDLPLALAGMKVVDAPALAPAPCEVSDQAIWTCAAVLNVAGVHELQSVLAEAAVPWVLDWSAVRGIEESAAGALHTVFAQWAGQSVDVRCHGMVCLLELLKLYAPSGSKEVPHVWWHLRLAALRLMGQADEFEIVALEFCITYELSPPSWEPAACHFEAIAATDRGFHPMHEMAASPLAAANGGLQTQFLPDAPEGGPMVEFSGEMCGDAQAVLVDLESRLSRGNTLIISCRHLIRVDFSAAVAMLNWLSGHYMEGRRVRFIEVHRLVSMFFQIIGITEYAKVALRND